MNKFEQIRHPEQIITEQEVVSALDGKGVEDQEVKELLIKYVDQCHKESDSKVAIDPNSSNRSNIEAEIKIAILYSKTRDYKEQALEAFEDLYMAAYQDDSTRDLAEQIDSLINSLDI